MKHIFPLFLLAAVLIPWNETHAYVTTDQHAFFVTGSSAIYAIEFEFGHGDHDIHIPVLAQDTNNTSREYLSYGIFNDEDERVTDMRTAGIVLADAPIENSEYVIPAGETRTLTLLIIASAEADMATSEVYAEVTYLPFTFDGEETLQLNPSELQYYKTPSLTLPIEIQVGDISFSPVD